MNHEFGLKAFINDAHSYLSPVMIKAGGFTVRSMAQRWLELPSWKVVL